MKVRAHKHLKLPEKPVSIEFFDVSSQYPLFIVSTYELGADSSRKGSFFVIDAENLCIKSCKVAPAGIFRVKVDNNIVYAALTNGSLIRMTLPDFNFTDIPICNDCSLLSISVHNNHSTLLTSDDRGFLHIIDTNTGEKDSFTGHNLPYTNEPCEVWSAVWCSWNQTIVSGGDDGLLKCWDLRCANRLVAVNKSHTYGIVFLDVEKEFSIISGCYDECVRRIDLRIFGKTALERNVGGGVWNVTRLSRATTAATMYLASCMYGGWVIIDEETFEIQEADRAIGASLLYDALYDDRVKSVLSCTFNNYTVTRSDLS